MKISNRVKGTVIVLSCVMGFVQVGFAAGEENKSGMFVAGDEKRHNNQSTDVAPPPPPAPVPAA